jgi:hypothetical protein
MTPLEMEQAVYNGVKRALTDIVWVGLMGFLIVWTVFQRSPGRQRSGWWSAAENMTPHVKSGTPLARPCQLVPPYGKSNVCVPPLFIVTTDGLYVPRISTLALSGDKLACSSKGLSASAADHRRRPTAGCLPTLLCVSRPSTNESRFRVGLRRTAACYIS